jgi:hypothetical protein
MSNSKTDCTIQQGNTFKVMLVPCEQHESLNSNEAIKQIETALIASCDVKVLHHRPVLDASDIEPLISYALVEKPQALVMVSIKGELQSAKLLSKLYNNQFHNSPNVLYTALAHNKFVSEFTTCSSFDIGINNNLPLLIDLINNIKMRKHNDDLVDFSFLKGLAYRSHGPVNFV